MRTTAITLIIVLGIQAPAYATCGERGGPGYRAPNGRCVGWADIGKTCGNPPTTRCTAEQTASGAGRAAEHGAEIEKLRKQSVPAVK